MSRQSGAVASALAGVLFGCQPAVDVRNPSPFDEDDPAARAEQPEPPTPSADPVAPAPASPREERAGPEDARAGGAPLRERGTLERETLEEVLEAGLSDFLAGVEVAPDLDVRQNFQGWEILRYEHGGSLLQPGDVVTSVNGHRLERPSQVQALWETLGAAESIVVRGRRGERPFVLRVEVVDSAPGAAATGAAGGPQARSSP